MVGQRQLVTLSAHILVVLFVLLIAARPAQAQTESILYPFACTNGGGGACTPWEGVVLDKGGNVYGTTTEGGTSALGVIFKVTPSGAFSTLYNFCSASECADGGWPIYGLVIDKEGNLYGATVYGGAFANGTVFKVTPSGTETVLYNFTSSYSIYYAQPNLALDSKGNLYGVTPDTFSIFKLTPSGTYSTLYTFCSAPNCADGNEPLGGVILDKLDNLYGTTKFGGANGLGIVFKLTPSGTETVLHSFDANGEDGFYPEAGVILDSKDNIYGTTTLGGKIGVGSVFEVTASGTETILYSFAAGADGFSPYASLVFDKKHNLYGTTAYGGSYGSGTVFEVTPKGVETVLHSFERNGTDGYFPATGLAINAAGDLYGTTTDGGSGKGTACVPNGCGVVFKVIP
ncbi:MAG: choice-of-anchor tandem repeat GloVer-containing protein [Terriglobales bacterium]|jgi:uncharacterized repeat protein (TIGR03803 family)